VRTLRSALLALPEQSGTAVSAEMGQAVDRRALGCQPRLLDDPRDDTERRLKLFGRGIPPDRDDDREAISE
jgi:hypothetical protein